MGVFVVPSTASMAERYLRDMGWTLEVDPLRFGRRLRHRCGYSVDATDTWLTPSSCHELLRCAACEEAEKNEREWRDHYGVLCDLA
jgi:hypothetical protein